jgi:hypothetical protein
MSRRLPALMGLSPPIRASPDAWLRLLHYRHLW